MKYSLDEWTEKLVDRLVEAVPRNGRYLKIRVAQSGLGWHAVLLASGLKQSVHRLLRNFRSEEDMDLFLSDTADQVSQNLGKIGSFLLNQGAWAVAIEEAGIALRLWTCAFFLLLSALGVALTGSSELSFVSGGIGLLFVSTAIDAHVPAFSGIPQPYLVSRLIASLGYLVHMAGYYLLYLKGGIRTNVILQGSMIFMLVVHLTLFLVLVALNRNQQPFVRALAGVTGIMPALLAATAFALSAVGMGQGLWSFARGMMRVWGGIFLFADSLLEMLLTLGSVRISYGKLLMWLLSFFGFLLCIGAAWM